jgi:hypothetical protein
VQPRICHSIAGYGTAAQGMRACQSVRKKRVARATRDRAERRHGQVFLSELSRHVATSTGCSLPLHRLGSISRASHFCRVLLLHTYPLFELFNYFRKIGPFCSGLRPRPSSMHRA